MTMSTLMSTRDTETRTQLFANSDQQLNELCAYMLQRKAVGEKHTHGYGNTGWMAYTRAFTGMIEYCTEQGIDVEQRARTYERTTTDHPTGDNDTPTTNG